MTNKTVPNRDKMTNSEIDQENETYTSSYSSFLTTPRYQSIVVDVGSGALTSQMLTEAANKARSVDWGIPTGITSYHAYKIIMEMEEERKIKEKMKATPVGAELFDD